MRYIIEDGTPERVVEETVEEAADFLRSVSIFEQQISMIIKAFPELADEDEDAETDKIVDFLSDDSTEFAKEILAEVQSMRPGEKKIIWGVEIECSEEDEQVDYQVWLRNNRNRKI